MCRELSISPKLAFEGEEVSSILGLVSARAWCGNPAENGRACPFSPVAFCRVSDDRSEGKIGLAVSTSQL
ncbi:hypothetical protein P3X63_14860 [Bacillus sp. HSf4]|nr:hypothetical protein [Bacillus sp. HSf4]WFA03919.1 hypothetical protein P3X63_14860 [Bacillus sp. HSf4]